LQQKEADAAGKALEHRQSELASRHELVTQQVRIYLHYIQSIESNDI